MAKITKEEREKLVSDYEKYGVEYMIKTYGYKDKKSVVGTIKYHKKILSSLKAKTLFTPYDEKVRDAVLKYCQKNGIIKTVEKYGVSKTTIYTWIKKYNIVIEK